MFKLESYITPILLSYVDKYIKNFRPQDSQVSLWGGDASFHNLDLRLEVLEQELQLPFSFVSGHIHELLIHVPWTKLASEPISITINTIECVLKLRGEDPAGSDTTSQTSTSTNPTRDRRKTNRRQDVVAPPSYVQSLVNKIVSNINIFCNNLILKYVEEDIVLSVNVKTVTLQSANETWEPAFTELSPTQIMLRKVISLADLTICLDKRNASGKIEMYQEPLLYRCSMDVHLLRSYHSVTAKRATVTRVDIHCKRMDFSLTEQQVPMLMRLAVLALALHAKELRPEPAPSSEEILDPDEELSLTDGSGDESWAGWAWSWVPSILPIYWDEDMPSDQPIAYSGHTYHTGFYVEQASVALKVTENTGERSYYGPRKVKFVPFLLANLKGCFMDLIMAGAGWLNMQMGVSYLSIKPQGECFCGIKDDYPLNSSTLETDTDREELLYFLADGDTRNYMAGSLFDPTSVENKSQKRTYSVSWDYHIVTVTETTLLERSPALALDYVYMIELPEDFNSERLSELGSDLEYSNLHEKSLCRFVVGPMVVRLCSGLFHRIQMIQHSGNVYDYSPYSTPKPELTREQLPPASAEDFDALDSNIPIQVYQVTLFKPTIYFQLAHHPSFDPASFSQSRKRKRSKPKNPHSNPQMKYLPEVMLDCRCLDARLVRPMYPRRLVTTVCQLPAPPQHMFHACHLHVNVKLLDVSSHLVLNPGTQTKVLMPSNIAYNQEKLLLTHYWIDPDLAITDKTLSAENLTITCTKAKLMVIFGILRSQLDCSDSLDLIQNSSLLIDAEKHVGVEYLELCVDGLSYRSVITPVTSVINIHLAAVKAFVLEFPTNELKLEPQQALVLSGPENSNEKQADTDEEPLLSLTMQRTLNPKNQVHPPLLVFRLREVRACVDPMMWRWLRYSPEQVLQQRASLEHPVVPSSGSSVNVRRLRRLSSENSGGVDLGRRAPTPQESVHSSSDQMLPPIGSGAPLSPVAHSQDTPASSSAKRASTPTETEIQGWWNRDNLLLWFAVWRGLVLSGEVAHCVVYLPSSSLSALGAQSIEDAIAQCLNKEDEEKAPKVLVVKFPCLALRSVAQKQGLQHYTSQLPVKLPETLWCNDKMNFPWMVSLTDLSCYTLQRGTRLHFLKPLSATATIGISTKYQTDQTSLASLGLCVHVDTTPMSIKMSEEQMQLMASILVGLLEFVASLQMFNTAETADVNASNMTDLPTPSSPTLFPESSGSQESPGTPCDTNDSSDQRTTATSNSEQVKITVWMQSTLARLNIALYTVNTDADSTKNELKLTFDMEDIMTSLDLQQVYLKVKCKVAYASIQHYIRKYSEKSWRAGSYCGLVMQGHEDLSSSPHTLSRDMDEAGGFFSMTFTRARCRNVHSRWGARKQASLLANTRQCDNRSVPESLSARYISEIVVKLQAVDFIFSAATLDSFTRVISPMLALAMQSDVPGPTESKGVNWAMKINNNSLPLLYLDTRCTRFILPAKDLGNMQHDVCLLQLDSICLTPQADNPLGRIVVRHDIYHMAQQMRMLGVPGSEVEDRQYQLDITGFSVNTGTWTNLEQCLSLGRKQRTGLHTMSENPALEWNNLTRGAESITPHMALLPVIGRLNMCIVAAPAIVFRGDILVCGHSLEFNAVTDIEVSISMEQLFLASALLKEILQFLKPLIPQPTYSQQNIPMKEKQHPMPYSATLVKTFPEKESVGADHNRFVDSGVDCADASSMSLAGGGSALAEERRLARKIVPVEVLLTAGTVTFALYEQVEASKLASMLREKVDNDEDRGYEAGSEEGSTEDVLVSQKKIQPMVHILIAQPHAFLSRQSISRKVQLSCFDFSIRLGEPGRGIPRGIPGMQEFPQVLLETKGGDPHPDTGIPPAFITTKWSRSLGKAAKIEMEFGRPTKLHFSILAWTYMQSVINKVMTCFQTDIPIGSSSSFQPYSEPSWSSVLKPNDKLMKHIEKTEVESHMPPHHLHCGDLQENPPETTEKSSSFIRNNLGAVASISASLQQLVIVGSTARNTSQVVLSLAGLNGNISCIMRGQSDRMTACLDITSLMITTTVACEGSPRILLNPWSCSVNVCLAWEPWQPMGSPPLIQLTADSDCIMVDLGPEHLRCLHTIFNEYSPFLNSFQSQQCKDVSCDLEVQNPDQDQHYRDDLRAGAFQFVDAGTAHSSEDLPLPYQVVFWQTPPTMAWRYPQPRALTRVDIFPVPFKVATDHRLGREPKERVLCSLQYWSECRSCYQPYAQFQLSESDMCRLQLPPPPHQVVACTWRVQLSLETEDEDIQSSGSILISPRALAACMRVDSFFTPEQVPTFQAALNISMLKVSLHNHIHDARPLPPPLDNFMMDELMPESQSFASVTMDNASFFLCTRNGSSQLMELSGHVRCDVVDYAFLTQQSIVESFQCRLQLTMQDRMASLGCVTRPITVKFGPSIGHTLAVSAQLWNEAIGSLTSEHQLLSKYQVLLSRYVICNDTTSPLRFGQVLTDENILLGSRSCHLYSWRTQKTRQLLRVGIEEGGWVWSKPFSIDSDGTQVCNLMETPNINIVVSVSSLSSTQKKVILSGQFVVTNLLVEHLECRVMTTVDKEGTSRAEGQNLIAVGKSTAPSVLLDTSKKLALRIRFQCIEGSWSGDIPLRENTKSGQPWLVKVPLPDRGQFLSIWCRVITQQLTDGIKILAMLSPLYMICSHLPMPAKVLIDTPGLKVHLQTSVEGRGEQQQLYCPGTVDHSHKLTFQQEHGVPPSNPYVPLSYSMVDQRRFFQIPENNGALDLDTVLDTLYTSKSLKWPYVGEEYEGITWVSAEQPETHVQVKYEPLGPYCKTLLVELQPWALLVNTLGCAITLIVEELVVCRVAHQGVVAPPKLENNFNFGVDTDGILYSSPPLQLTRPDWSSSFYMPRISGLIPNTGNVQTVIQCGSTSSAAAILSITSNFVRDMRILHVHSSYVVCNYTNEVLQVFALAVRDTVKFKLPWPCSQNSTCIKNVPPDPSNKTQMGIPLVHWSMQGEDGGGEMNLYVAFSIGATGWSCPLKIGDKPIRCSFTVPSTPDVKGLSTKALVLSVQERAGQFYLSVFPDIHPQIIVHNMCRFAILCAQGEGEHDTTTAVPENLHFDWWCEIPAYSSVHYTLPMAADRFPDIPPALGTTWAPLVLSLVDELSWSRGFSIAETQEQFVRLPNHGDVKVRVEKLVHTTHVTIDTVSHVEISARDIRSRLLLCSDEASFTESIAPESYYLKDSCSRTVSLSKLPGVIGTPDSSSETNKHTVILGLPESKMESEQFDNQSHETSSTCSILTVAENTQKVSLSRWCLQVASFVQGIHLTLLDDVTSKDSMMERNEIIALSLDNICVTIHPQRLSSERGIEQLMVCFSIGDLQLDNQMFYKGGFDFPVVVVGQTQSFHRKQGRPTLNIPAIKLVQKFRPSSLVTIRMLLEKHEGKTAMKMLKVTLEPLRAYVEDTLITKLSENLTRLSLPALVHWTPASSPASQQYLTSGAVPVPAVVSWESRQIAFPVQIHSLIVDPISLLLSVHTSVKLYIALDHSPLHFSAFERRSIVTTPYRLGHALTMHYLSGALFGAGWVVGSLELLGSPGGFARSLGTGLRDFVSLPFHGLFEGPWGFLVGVTHGSASLMKHITAGTLSSVTKLAASVARNLDRLTLDEEHMARTEEMRRLKPQGLTQGLVRGLTGLGISLLGAVSGIAHHPLQAVINEGPSPRGFVTGVGRGLVGVITKPLSGAAELLALTGEGLLHGAGWASIPEVRQYPVTEYILSTVNSRLKYNWKIIMVDSVSSHARLLHVMEATHITPSGAFEAVTLVLTTRALFLIDTEKDVTKRVLSLMELTGHPEGTTADPTLLSFLVREMDVTESGPHLSAGPSHDRVVDFVRRSSGMVGADHAKPNVESVVSKNPLLVSEHLSSTDKPLMFCVNPQSRNYFLSLFMLAKRQIQGKGFSLL